MTSQRSNPPGPIGHQNTRVRIIYSKETLKTTSTKRKENFSANAARTHTKAAYRSFCPRRRLQTLGSTSRRRTSFALLLLLWASLAAGRSVSVRRAGRKQVQQTRKHKSSLRKADCRGLVAHLDAPRYIVSAYDGSYFVRSYVVRPSLNDSQDSNICTA